MFHVSRPLKIDVNNTTVVSTFKKNFGQCMETQVISFYTKVFSAVPKRLITQ